MEHRPCDTQLSRSQAPICVEREMNVLTKSLHDALSISDPRPSALQFHLSYI